VPNPIRRCVHVSRKPCIRRHNNALFRYNASGTEPNAVMAQCRLKNRQENGRHEPSNPEPVTSIGRSNCCDRLRWRWRPRDSPYPHHRNPGRHGHQAGGDSGSSIGAIMGAAMASGLSGEEIREFTLGTIGKPSNAIGRMWKAARPRGVRDAMEGWIEAWSVQYRAHSRRVSARNRGASL
jgi:hypothetical protein